MSERTVADSGTELLQSYLDTLLAEVPADMAGAEAGDCAQADIPADRVLATADPDPLPIQRDADWRSRPFQALLFHVHSVQLAAPLVQLFAVLPWTDQVVGLPATPDWFLGLFPYRDRQVRVVDTAKLVLQGQKIDVARPRHIVLLNGGDWGMTCHGLNEVLTIEPEAVKWRTNPGRRPWLAGTVREKLCAMVDVDAFAGMLERSVT